MSPFGLVFRRLLERRLLGDDVAGASGTASSIPGAATTLGVSLVFSGFALQERPLEDVALLLATATMVWSFLRALLDPNGATDRLDRAVLEPLPLARSTIALARALVLGVLLLVATLNLALPPIVLVAFGHGASVGLRLFCAAVLAAFVGMSVAGLARGVLARAFGRARLDAWEGPLLLGIGVALFATLFLAPSPTYALERWPWLAHVPPFSLAALASESSTAALPTVLITAAAAALALLFAVRLGSSDDRGSRRERVSSRVEPAQWRRWLVLPAEAAGFAFAWAQIGRDRTFRSRVHPLFAFPFAVIVLVAMKPGEPLLALMALYGAGVYAVMAETFLAYSESVGGPQLLVSLPIFDVAGFRIGAEKAFLLRVVVPVFLVLALGLVVLAVFSRGPGFIAAIELTLLALGAATLMCQLGFERIPDLPFSATDRGAYPGDVASVAFTALLFATVFALAAAPVSGRSWLALVEVIVLWTMIRLVFVRKRKRWRATSEGSPNPDQSGRRHSAGS